MALIGISVKNDNSDIEKIISGLRLIGDYQGKYKKEETLYHKVETHMLGPRDDISDLIKKKLSTTGLQVVSIDYDIREENKELKRQFDSMFH